MPRLRLVFFLDGCFFASWAEHGHAAKSNRSYWIPKLARNVSRNAVSR